MSKQIRRFITDELIKMNYQRFQTSASIALLRTILICINTIFLISGALLVLIGILLRCQYVNVEELTSEMNSSAPFVIIGLGLIIFLVGLSAFWCTLKGQITFLYIYACLMLLIFFAEILLAVTILMKKRTLEQTMNQTLKKVLDQYPQKSLATHIDHLQSTLSCCGIHSYKDWFETPYGRVFQRVPESCCLRSLNHTCQRTHLTDRPAPTDVHLTGCFPTVKNLLRHHYPLIGSLLFLVASIPLFSAIFSCVLLRQLGKHRYEPVE